MDRDTILESFQAISQNQNFEECIQIMESVNWDLGKALDSLETPNEHIPSIYSMDIDSDNFLGESNSVSKGLLFEFIVAGEKTCVHLGDHQTVGDLVDSVKQKFECSNCEVKINGVDAPCDRNTVLRSLDLPTVNTVVATVSNSGCHPRTSSEFELRVKIYRNSVYDQDLVLPFKPTDSVGTVKNHVAVITTVDKSRQRWSGWPQNIVGSEVTLADSGLDHNASLRVDLPVSDANTSQQLNRPINKFPESSLNNTRTEPTDLDDDEDDYDYQADLDLAVETPSTTAKNSLSLVEQGAHSDPVVATLMFVNEFERRFCSHTFTDNYKNTQPDSVVQKPPFITASLEESISSTVGLPPLDRKPMFIFIYHGDSIQANIFSAQTMCYSEICLYFINSGYNIWPWDITYAESKNQLFSWLTRSFGAGFTSRLKIISKDEYPVLVAIGKFRGSYEMLEIFDNIKSREQILQGLWDVKQRFTDLLVPDINAWQEREHRELVKKEQDDAYKESLQIDQIKEKSKFEEEQKLHDEEERQKQLLERAEQDRQRLVDAAASRVPPEPTAEEDVDGAGIITVRLRMPNQSAAASSCVTRRFQATNSLDQLICFMESLGYLRSHFKLLTTYPKKNLTDMENQKITLKELGFPRRENLIIENK